MFGADVMLETNSRASRLFSNSRRGSLPSPPERIGAAFAPSLCCADGQELHTRPGGAVVTSVDDGVVEVAALVVVVDVDCSVVEAGAGAGVEVLVDGTAGAVVMGGAIVVVDEAAPGREAAFDGDGVPRIENTPDCKAARSSAESSHARANVLRKCARA